jgi:ribosomal protein L32E
LRTPSDYPLMLDEVAKWRRSRGADAQARRRTRRA